MHNIHDVIEVAIALTMGGSILWWIHAMERDERERKEQWAKVRVVVTREEILTLRRDP